MNASMPFQHIFSPITEATASIRQSRRLRRHRNSGSTNQKSISPKNSQHTHFYWILISLSLFICLAYCDDDIITPSSQSFPQKRGGGKRLHLIHLFLIPQKTAFWIKKKAFAIVLVLIFINFDYFSGGGGGGGSSTNNGILDVKDHCNKTVEIYEDVSSPELTNLNRNRPLLCTYRFRSFRGAPRDWVLRIRFKRFKVGNILNATHCDGGYLQVNLSFHIHNPIYIR